MMDAAAATIVSNAAKTGDNPASVPSTVRTGNEFLDEMNMAVLFAAMKGLNTAYINISKYPRDTVDNCVDKLEDLMYIIDRTRERSYGEIFVTWE